MEESLAELEALRSENDKLRRLEQLLDDLEAGLDGCSTALYDGVIG